MTDPGDLLDVDPDRDPIAPLSPTQLRQTANHLLAAGLDEQLDTFVTLEVESSLPSGPVKTSGSSWLPWTAAVPSRPARRVYNALWRARQRDAATGDLVADMDAVANSVARLPDPSPDDVVRMVRCQLIKASVLELQTTILPPPLAEALTEQGYWTLERLARVARSLHGKSRWSLWLSVYELAGPRDDKMRSEAAEEISLIVRNGLASRTELDDDVFEELASRIGSDLDADRVRVLLRFAIDAGPRAGDVAAALVPAATSETIDELVARLLAQDEEEDVSALLLRAAWERSSSAALAARAQAIAHDVLDRDDPDWQAVAVIAPMLTSSQQEQLVRCAVATDAAESWSIRPARLIGSGRFDTTTADACEQVPVDVVDRVLRDPTVQPAAMTRLRHELRRDPDHIGDIHRAWLEGLPDLSWYELDQLLAVIAERCSDRNLDALVDALEIVVRSADPVSSSGARGTIVEKAYSAAGTVARWSLDRAPRFEDARNRDLEYRDPSLLVRAAAGLRTWVLDTERRLVGLRWQHLSAIDTAAPRLGPDRARRLGKACAAAGNVDCLILLAEGCEAPVRNQLCDSALTILEKITPVCGGGFEEILEARLARLTRIAWMRPDRPELTRQTMREFTIWNWFFRHGGGPWAYDNPTLETLVELSSSPPPELTPFAWDSMYRLDDLDAQAWTVACLHDWVEVGDDVWDELWRRVLDIVSYHDLANRAAGAFVHGPPALRRQLTDLVVDSWPIGWSRAQLAHELAEDGYRAAELRSAAVECLLRLPESGTPPDLAEAIVASTDRASAQVVRRWLRRERDPHDVGRLVSMFAPSLDTDDWPWVLDTVAIAISGGSLPRRLLRRLPLPESIGVLLTPHRTDNTPAQIVADTGTFEALVEHVDAAAAARLRGLIHRLPPSPRRPVVESRLVSRFPALAQPEDRDALIAQLAAVVEDAEQDSATRTAAMLAEHGLGGTRSPEWWSTSVDELVDDTAWDAESAVSAIASVIPVAAWTPFIDRLAETGDDMRIAALQALVNRLGELPDGSHLIRTVVDGVAELSHTNEGAELLAAFASNPDDCWAAVSAILDRLEHVPEDERAQVLRSAAALLASAGSPSHSSERADVARQLVRTTRQAADLATLSAVVAALDHVAAEIEAPSLRTLLVEILDRSEWSSRQSVLELIRASAGMLERCVGADGVREIAHDVAAVGRWWP